jgi:hypothetical protein
VPGHGGELGGLGPGVGDRDGDELAQHRVDRSHRSGRRDLRDPRRVVRVPEQPRPLGAQRGDPAHEPGRVVRVAARPPGDRRAVHLLAQRPIGKPGEHRLAGREREGEQERAVVAAGGGGTGGRGHGIGGEPVEPRRVVDDDRGVVRVGEQPGAELGGQRRQLAVERAQPLLLGRTEPGPGPDGVTVVVLEQPQRLRVQAEVVPAGVQRVDAREQCRIEGDGVGVRGQPRADLRLDLADRG